MARERWFYAHEEARHGPHQLPELVDALLALPEPRTRLVWTRGLESWTRAARVPRLAEELNQHLPEVPPPAPAPPPPAAPAPAPATATPATGTTGAIPRPRPAPTAPPPEVVETGTGLSRPAIYVGGALLLAIAAGAVVLGLRAGDPAPSASVTPGAAVAPDGVAIPPAGGAGPAGATDPAAGTATGGDPTVVGWSAVETDVPATEFGLLKGVAAWEGDELTVTVYNGSRWRITEILVRTSVLEGDHFVDSALLYPLVPRQEVDANVAPILEQVAPDRRRPAVNPDDTRAFTGRAGEKPRAYRWRIEAARGYAPIIR